MEKFRKAYRFIKSRYDLLSGKKYTTLAGTLVFFFIMSIVPLTFWLTLIVGRLPIDVNRILQLSVFSSVKNILQYVQREAANATTGASVILLATTLYSSTNLFYQMRKSGELIYDFRRQKRGLHLRIGALILMFIIMAMMLVFVLLFALGTFLFSRYFSGIWEQIADYTLLSALAFALALLLNVYICPYKAKLRLFLPGALITLAAWAVAVTGFAVYLKISNMDKLYGTLSIIIVFLLWLYVLMICFLVGVIFNSEKILLSRKQAAKRTQQAPKSSAGAKARKAACQTNAAQKKKPVQE